MDRGMAEGKERERHGHGKRCEGGKDTREVEGQKKRREEIECGRGGLCQLCQRKVYKGKGRGETGGCADESRYVYILL